MKFHQFKLSIDDEMRLQYPLRKKLSQTDFYEAVLTDMENQGFEYSTSQSERNTFYRFAAEYRWLKNRRAFYNVYPSIVTCLENTSLTIKPSQLIDELQPIAICFSEGNEPRVNNGFITSMIFEKYSNPYEDNPGRPFVGLLIDRREGDRNCFTYFMVQQDEVLSALSESFETKKKLISIAIGVSLLAKDERYCEPILLQRDQKRVLDSSGQKKAVDRARRNGINGFTVGKHVEIPPGIRRPHFKLFPVGKGRKRYELRPWSGCVVNRSKIYPIPTGYLDETEAPELNSDDSNFSATSPP